MIFETEQRARGHVPGSSFRANLEPGGALYQLGRYPEASAEYSGKVCATWISAANGRTHVHRSSAVVGMERAAGRKPPELIFAKPRELAPVINAIAVEPNRTTKGT